jgi:uncharacterized protein
LRTETHRRVAAGEISMNLAIHDEVVTTFAHSLRSLSDLLDKARAHATTQGYDVDVLTQARLFPDMFAFARQVQLATDFAKGAAARLAGVEVPQWDNNETTMDELQSRVRRCVDFIESLAPERFDGAAERPIELNVPAGKLHFTGAKFLMHWAIPNFYFHYATAYNLLRHNGVPIGKLDYLGGTAQD